jgi:hypothetical protein
VKVAVDAVPEIHYRNRKQSKMTSNSKHIACDITALTNEEIKFLTAISFDLFASIREVKNLPDGYAFQLQENDETLSKLFDFIAYNRICCPFVIHTLVVASKSEVIWLHLTGPEGTKNFITSEFLSFPDHVFAPKFKENIFKLSKMPSSYK